MQSSAPDPDSANAAAQAFIERWQPSGGSERSNYQLFLTELCELLDVPRPGPASSDNRQNDYVFERAIEFDNGDGTRSTRFADLYRRGCFICETKQGVEQQEAQKPVSATHQAANKKRRTGHGRRGAGAYDDATQRAKGQAEGYARNLQADQGRPPLLQVVDDAQKKPAKKAARAKIRKRPWPKTLSQQAAAVQSAPTTIAVPADEQDVAKHFTRAKKERIAERLETLESVGRAWQLDNVYKAAIGNRAPRRDALLQWDDRSTGQRVLSRYVATLRTPMPSAALLPFRRRTFGPISQDSFKRNPAAL